jgi:hypothetical protein
MLPFDEFPVTMQFIEYPPPAILKGKLHKNGILTDAGRLIQIAGPPLDKVAKKLSAKSFQFASLFIGLTFERLLLKVAYCFAIAALGFENIMECYVVPSILGTSEEIGTWLGCDGKECLKPAGFHSASVSVVEKQIICRLKLFSAFPVPEYVVVVGKINEELTGNMPLSGEKHF